jgi:DNA-directed RNA polymerase specialized sigma24 family protein
VLTISVAKLRNFAQIVPATKSVPGTLQEGGASFQTTHWTLVLRAAQNESTESVRQALSAFCEGYWPPLYAFLRHRRYSSTDAQDLVQAFFAHLLAQNTLSHADQAKGRLRTFLLGSLQNFLINEHDRARALKRGGKYEILSFDQHLPEAEAAMSGTACLNDVSCYDLTWASNVVRRSWRDLHEEFAAEGKVKLLEELKPLTSQASATLEAPAQTELRPTCAGASSLASPNNVTPKSSHSDCLIISCCPEQDPNSRFGDFLSYASGSTLRTDLTGVTSQASATLEAPAQAELRPTCAGAPA